MGQAAPLPSKSATAKRMTNHQCPLSCPSLNRIVWSRQLILVHAKEISIARGTRPNAFLVFGRTGACHSSLRTGQHTKGAFDDDGRLRMDCGCPGGPRLWVHLPSVVLRWSLTNAACRPGHQRQLMTQMRRLCHRRHHCPWEPCSSIIRVASLARGRFLHGVRTLSNS